MAVRQPSRNRFREQFWRRVFGQLSRYDIVLAVIPVLFALAVAAGLILPIPFYVAVGVSAIVSSGLLADALFLNPPIESPSDV